MFDQIIRLSLNNLPWLSLPLLGYYFRVFTLRFG